MSEDRERALAWYVDELLRWNRRVNLVSRLRTREALMDEVRAISDLARWLPRKGGWAEVGVGGGLLAVPLALWRPDLWSVWLEVRVRRRAFLLHVVRTLDLRRVQVVAQPVETWHPHPRPQQIWVRALPRAPWRHLLRRRGELLEEGGSVIRVVSRKDLVEDAARVVPAGRFWMGWYPVERDGP